MNTRTPTTTGTLRMLGNTETITLTGETVQLTDLLDTFGRNAEVLCFKKNGFYGTCLQEVLPDNPENIPVVHITFKTGETFTVMETSSLLNLKNSKLPVYSIQPGDTVKTLTYNPNAPHPQLTPKTVEEVRYSVETFTPVVTFDIHGEDNFLMKAEKPGTHAMVLIPVYPEQVDMSSQV